MKKLSILFLLLIILAPIYATSEDGSTILKVNASVPEDYGVYFPRNAYHLDHIYFEMETELVSTSGIVTEFSTGGMEMTLLYYGNQEETNTVIFALPDELWWFAGNQALVAVDAVIEDADLDDDIIVTENGPRSVLITVPATGPRRGEEVAKIRFSWDLSPDLSPASLEFPLDMYLGVNL